MRQSRLCKLTFLKHLLALLMLSGLAGAVAASTPVGPMGYQGRLLDANGVPVSGPLNFVIRIYDQLDAPGGVLLYQESHPGLPVTDGVYSIKIGEINDPDIGSWDLGLWQGNMNNLYLEIEVENEVLSPRTELTSSPHAFTSTLALSAESLGAKTAAEYDNILEGVCVASKGKWLDAINTCMGSGSEVLSETLGSMMVSVNTDFTNLDLTKANLTGSDFTGADFSGTVFKDTQISASGLAGVNLTGAVMEGVTSDAPLPSSNVNLTNATLSKMDLSSWQLDNATLTGLSAANLYGCPASLPTGWFCGQQSFLTYMLIGPGANLSGSSAAVISKDDGERYLNLDPGSNLLTNRDLTGVVFDGVTILQSLFGSTLTNASFKGSTLKTLRRRPITGAVNGADFSNAHLINIVFDDSIGNLDNVVFDQATLEHVRFDQGTDISFQNFSGFQYAVLKHVTFGNGVRASGKTQFYRSLLEDIIFDSDLKAQIEESTVTGKLTLPSAGSLLGIEISVIDGAEVTGNFTNLYIGESSIHYSEFKPSRTVTGFLISEVTMNSSRFEGDLNNTTIEDCTGNDLEFAGDWNNASFQSCNFTFLTWDEHSDDFRCPDGSTSIGSQCTLPAGNLCDGAPCVDF